MKAVTQATLEQHEATLAALTDSLVDIERTISSLQAARDGLLALGARIALQAAEQERDHDFADLAMRAVAAQFGAALRLSDRTIQRRMTDADWLVERFPAVWQAQGAGCISASHARAIVDAGAHLDEPTDRDAYARQMVVFAEHESPNRVANMARRIAERFQARTVDERHRDAVEERRIWVTDVADGMAELGVLAPAVLVHGVFDRLTAMAKAVDRSTDPTARTAVEGDRTATSTDWPAASADQRTIDQTRCDLAVDLLLTGAPSAHDGPAGALGAITAQVSVTIPVLTLLGSDAMPAELDGRTPIDTATAKAIAGAASGWDRLLTHPVSGELLAVDRYRPSSELRRHLGARDQRCRFPGCGRSPRDSDLDHTVDAAFGGPTEMSNLSTLCRRHHVLKHHSSWRIEQLGGGALAWTDPSGRIYIDRPPPQHTVTFREESPPF